MKNFFKQILSKIQKFDDYTKEYLKITNNIEIPSIAYTYWGMHYADIKDYENAIEKLETAVMMCSQNPKPCISLGIIYIKLKEYHKAENALKQALERDSNNSFAYTVLGNMYTEDNKPNLAEEMFKKALKISPSDADIYLNYGILYAKLQKRQKAAEMFKKSKIFNPRNANAYFLLGVICLELNKTSEAFSEFKKIEILNPNYKDLNYYIALCYQKEKNYPAVIEYTQRALKKNNTNFLVYILLAQAYMYLNKRHEMLEVFNLGERNGINNFEFFLAWGISLLKTNEIQEAKLKINKALEIKNNDSTALYKLGCCYHKEKNIQTAENYFRQSLKSNPLNSSALADLGIIYYEKNEYEEAIQTFLRAIEISSDKSYLYFYIANSFYKLGRFKKSINYYEKTTEYYPRHIEALINCTLCLLEINNEKEALRKIRKAYQINRNSEKVTLIYALTDLKAGIYSDAIEKIDTILDKNPDNKEAKLIKANALISINKPCDALNILYSLEENDKNSDMAIYLYYRAYKILVEENHSNYNENMYNLYLNRLGEINPDILNRNEISKHLSKMINKG